MRTVICAIAVALVAGSVMGADSAPNPQMVLDTTEGIIIIELFPDDAPKSVENVIRYAEDGFYAGTIFHRVIPSFMVQGGGFGQDMVKKQVGDRSRTRPTTA